MIDNPTTAAAQSADLISTCSRPLRVRRPCRHRQAGLSQPLVRPSTGRLGCRCCRNDGVGFRAAPSPATLRRSRRHRRTLFQPALGLRAIAIAANRRVSPPRPQPPQPPMCRAEPQATRGRPLRRAALASGPALRLDATTRDDATPALALFTTLSLALPYTAVTKI